jgi:hypothetical protein
MMSNNNNNNNNNNTASCGWAGLATPYGLDGPGIEAQ